MSQKVSSLPLKRKLEKYGHSKVVNNPLYEDRQSMKIKKRRKRSTENFLGRMSTGNISITVNDWIELFVEAIRIVGVKSRMPYLKVFEKMLSKLSMELEIVQICFFFEDLFKKLQPIDIAAIPLILEWCFVLHNQSLNLTKNPLRKCLHPKILRYVIHGVVHNSIRNCLILVLSSNIHLNSLYLFPNNHLEYWLQEFGHYLNHLDSPSLERYNLDLWIFVYSIMDEMQIEHNRNLNICLFDTLCICDYETWIIDKENFQTSIKWFRKRHDVMSTTKIALIILYQCRTSNLFCNIFFVHCISLWRFFRNHINLSLDKKKTNKRIHEDCRCSLSSINTNFLPLIMATTLQWILSSYSLNNKNIEDLLQLYQESTDILNTLVELSEYQFREKILDHLNYIKELTILDSNMSCFSNEFDYKPGDFILEYFDTFSKTLDSIILKSPMQLIIESLLQMYKIHKDDDEIDKKRVCLVLIFLILLNPRTENSVLLWVFERSIEISNGHFELGIYLASLLKKNIFPLNISKAVQLNILNFRSIHLINSQLFPYLQLFLVINNLKVENIPKFRAVHKVLDLCEKTLYQHFVHLAFANINSGNDIKTPINITFTIISLYLKLLFFFSENIQIASVFLHWRSKFFVRKGSLKKDVFANSIKKLINTSLLDIVEKLTIKNEEYDKESDKHDDDMEILEYRENNRYISDSPIVKSRTFSQELTFENNLKLSNFVCSCIPHILGVIYTPLIQRGHMSLYSFEYMILPDLSGFDDSDAFNNRYYISAKFGIHFLQKIIEYCGKQSIFDQDEFTGLINVESNISELEQANTQVNCIFPINQMHTCEILGRCFICDLYSYMEYLGIMKTIEKSKSFNISKPWIIHLSILSLISILNGYFNIEEMQYSEPSKVQTIFSLTSVRLRSSIQEMLLHFSFEDVYILLWNELLDDEIIIKEIYDIQRITFRSLLIYLFGSYINNQSTNGNLVNQKDGTGYYFGSIPISSYIIGLCRLFSLRLQCLVTDTKRSTIPIHTSSISPTISRNRSNTSDATPPRTNSNKRRITPIIVTSSQSPISSTSPTSNSRHFFLSNGNERSEDQYYEVQKINDCNTIIFHVSTLLSVIADTCEIYCQNDHNLIAKVRDFIEEALFLLLPSNSLGKNPIFTVETNCTNNNFQNNGFYSLNKNELNTISEQDENISEADEVAIEDDISNTNSYQNTQYLFNKTERSLQESIKIPNTKTFNSNLSFTLPLINTRKSREQWYETILLIILRSTMYNTPLHDIPSLITEIASRTALWNNYDSKKLLYNTSFELIKYCTDILYDELPEISLRLIRHYGPSILPSIQFIFVALLDKNSLFINKQLNEIPLINIHSEFECFHHFISGFLNLIHIIESSFELATSSPDNETVQKDYKWIKCVICLLNRSIEVLQMEIFRLERIPIPMSLENQENCATYQDVQEVSINSYWQDLLLECNEMLKYCQTIETWILKYWDNCEISQYKLKSSNIQDIGDLDEFITFDECEEGILQENLFLDNASYNDCKLTPHWTTFIKSMFL
ncbi:hypothetical protein cand_007160 [Cryptosporidium andersoni]|uniref:Uncharacterized protein n=1 Tax=Cryptosporidium andersoni TaxID=117008 RepID=A0A1J4MPZ3_9CRYT|nr:hypothetical protein cand_007160 [Cryptosporidium andersoni]